MEILHSNVCPNQVPHRIQQALRSQEYSVATIRYPFHRSYSRHSVKEQETDRLDHQYNFAYDTLPADQKESTYVSMCNFG